MAPTVFSEKPTLTGERVLLRPFGRADIDAMGPILADPELIRLTGSAHSSTATAGRGRTLDEVTLEWYATRHLQPDRLDLAVVDLATDACVGEVVLNEWQPENQACNFRILVGPGGQGRGLGSEATRLMLRHAFTATDLHRVELGVYGFNPRAQHVSEGAGFVVEGRRRDAFVFDGERFDEIVMAVLRPDWLAAQDGPGRTPDQVDGEG